MSKIKTSNRRRNHKTNIAPALRIPLAVTSTIPGHLRNLVYTLTDFSKAIEFDGTAAGSHPYLSSKHHALRSALSDVKLAAGMASGAFATLMHPVKNDKHPVEAVQREVREVHKLISAISEASGGIDCLANSKWTFKNRVTTDACLQAINFTANKLQAAVKPFGY